MIGEAAPEESAKAYEQGLRRHFAGAQWPRFDLVFLGLGEDGHTASLFPGTRALAEQNDWVISNLVDKLDTHRITLTAPALNHSAYIVFLVTGQQKADRLREVLEGPFDPDRLPAQLIEPEEGTLEWFVDLDSARKLSLKT
jgi:6-phosphogluconolactonase